jgi:hypothetical protein
MMRSRKSRGGFAINEGGLKIVRAPCGEGWVGVI